MFEKRTEGFEYLDSPDFDPALALKSYRFMSTVNKWLGGRRIAWDFVYDQALKHNRRLHLLDIGSGICDIPIYLARMARRHFIDLSITCIESNPVAISAARALIDKSPRLDIRLIECDILDFRSPHTFDCASGSLFFHHFSDQQILALIDKLRSLGVSRVLINDLHRCLPCYTACMLASIFSPAQLRHDALTSIKRGFRPAELDRLLSGSLPISALRVGTTFFCRVFAEIELKPPVSK